MEDVPPFRSLNPPRGRSSPEPEPEMEIDERKYLRQSRESSGQRRERRGHTVELELELERQPRRDTPVSRNNLSRTNSRDFSPRDRSAGVAGSEGRSDRDVHVDDSRNPDFQLDDMFSERDADFDGSVRGRLRESVLMDEEIRFERSPARRTDKGKSKKALKKEGKKGGGVRGRGGEIDDSGAVLECCFMRKDL